ncbi:MAG: PIN domain-containing protein [Anaerolineales bacterium]|nr:PIN domain-containing protein [Anaerolineales bacterium]
MVLLDTNVLVYAHDRRAPAKQLRATQVLSQLHGDSRCKLPAQVLAEFLTVTTRGVRPPLTMAQARSQIESFAQSWEVLNTTAWIVQEAARGVQEYRLAYYDAQIWASARLNQIPVVLSEDFSDGASLEGVRFVNPFSANFELAQWLG